MSKTQANLVLVIVTIIWGGGFIATNSALATFSPFYIMTIRFLGAAVLPLLIAYKDIQKLSKDYFKKGIITGVLLFFAFAFQTFGLQVSTPSINAFLTATNVVFVPYLLWLLMKRKPHKKEIIASIICLLGIALLTWKADMTSLQVGDILSLICAYFFALHIIALERYSSHIPTFAFTGLQMLTAGILSLFGACFFERMPNLIPMEAIMSSLYLIFISTLVAYLLQTAAQKYTTANSASLILSMEALFASLFSFLILHEMMSISMMIGAILIFSSIIYIEYKPKEKTYEL